jgi:CHAT domain-containing protein/Tfp pilus assembly protein PilF
MEIGRGRDKAAEPLLLQVLKIREKSLGGESPTVAASLEALADLYLDEARYDEADAQAQRALAIRQKAQGRDHVDVATSLAYLGLVRLNKGRYPEAEALFKEALALREKAGSRAQLNACNVLRFLGSLYRLEGRYADAESLIKRSLAVREKLQGHDHLDVCLDLNILALDYTDESRLAEAESIQKRVLAIREKRLAPEHKLMATTCNNLALLYLREARFAEAEPLFRRALSISTRVHGPDHPTTALLTDNLAHVFDAEGRYSLAEPLHRRALAAAEKALGHDHLDLARIYLRSLASSLSNQGSYNEAKPLYQRALAIMRKSAGPESPLLASCLASIANLDLNLGNWAQAESRFKQSRAIYDKAYGTQSAGGAETLGGIAVAAARQGRHAEAESLYKQGLAIREKLFGPDHPLVAATLTSYAELLLDRARYVEAESLCDRVIEIRDRAHSAPGVRSRSYCDRAQAQWGLKERSDALRDLKEAMTLAEEQRGLVGGAEHERAESFRQVERSFELMVAWQTELGDVGEALHAIERARGRSLLDEMNMGGADLLVGRSSAERASLRRREAELKVDIATVEKQLGQIEADGATAKRPKAEVAQLRARLNRARDALYQFYRDERGNNPVYRNLLSVEASLPRVAQIRHRLVHDDGLLLVYFFGVKGGYVVAIGSNSEQLVELKADSSAAKELAIDAGPLTTKQLQKALLNKGKNGVVQLLSDPDTALTANSKLAALWRILVPDAQRQAIAKGNLNRLIIIPDGPLSLLPVETLVVDAGESPRYLLDVAPPISYGPSVTVLYNLAGRRAAALDRNQTRVLTVGDPLYPAESEGSSKTATGALKDLTTRSRYAALGLSPRPLPYSGVESGSVAEDFRSAGVPTTQLQRDKATKANLRENTAGSRVIHLACHGLAEQSYGNFFGALFLTPGPQAEIDPANDGFLTLSEIYELDLKDCELTVLSACETNHGPQQEGEGVWALSRGFLVAGSRRVVASNWLVDDEAAASLISYFCTQIAQAGKTGEADYAQSLYDAKRWVRQQDKWHNPFYWGTFVLVGPK